MKRMVVYYTNKGIILTIKTIGSILEHLATNFKIICQCPTHSPDQVYAWVGAC